MNSPKIYVGIDVGSTTVKAVVMDGQTKEIVWQDYHRHETKQPEKVLYFLHKIEEEFPDVSREEMQVYMTGSGSMSISKLVGAKFVQEVTAVCIAAEKLYPDVGSVIDLGGQDSKIIIFKENEGTDRKQKIPSMNDKCAGGTGAVLDKINAKLSLSPEDLARQEYDDIKIHPVAGKCGVFAETDINSLQKTGVRTAELMASLFEAIVLQNLTVLTRGHTLRPHVLLIGGPNTYIVGMKQAWKHHIAKVWEDRNYPLPEGVDPKDLVYAPDNSLYFAAIGAIEYGIEEEEEPVYLGGEQLEFYIQKGRFASRDDAEKGLVDSDEEYKEFYRKYAPTPFVPAKFFPGQKVQGFIGLDVGSTSTKAVLMSAEKEVMLKAYQLSRGNPIEDTKGVLRKMHDQVREAGAELEILGVVTTGYGKDVLKDVLQADAALVETVAHTKSALHYYDEVDVICDVGGQDIKIMMLRDGQVKDFKLNTQCSAGNGYFLQSTCESFGIPVEQYAENAFRAQLAPTFSYGCAVFLQSDIVNFQRLGWSREEILAGLARVLPKNIWLYVAQIPNFAKLGTRFVLQGGTQHNLAAVKAQVDFIESRFAGKDEEPTIIVHQHCGESGAIGAALEAIKFYEEGDFQTNFIGLDATERITYSSTCDESTRCNFCKNKCLRTFIDLEIAPKASSNGQTEKVPAELLGSVNGNGNGHAPDSRRIIVGNFCEKGSVEDLVAMRDIKKGMDATIKATPNLIELSTKALFKSYKPEKIPPRTEKGLFKKVTPLKVDLSKYRIGIPRVLLSYSLAPVYTTYFESLGVKKGNIVYSDFTDEKLYRKGGKRGSIDPCYPSKVPIAHMHNLLFEKHQKRALNMIFFPMVADNKCDIPDTIGNFTCPSIVPVPEVVRAAYTKEEDLFAKFGIEYVNPFLNMAEDDLFEEQMYETFHELFGITRKENALAVREALKARVTYRKEMQMKSKEVLETHKDKVGIVLLGRPYHRDPGINHKLFEEFQKLGYPIFVQDILPQDEETLEQLFGEEVRQGIISDPMDISDVWKRTQSVNANIKLWAAKFVARHPNLVAIELSNFKCGHDAPIYNVIEEIIECSGTPFFSLKDLDENKPTGSFKLRVETVDYFLKQYRIDKFGEPEKEKEKVLVEKA
jgi:predicted CoA-substrate-specific enzyme activase